MILDTDMLIGYFRGEDAARRFPTRVPFPERTVSALMVMELLQGCCDPCEMRETAAFVSATLATVLYPTEVISRLAIRLLELHALGAGLRVVDALIATTALAARDALATATGRPYRVIAGLSLVTFRSGRSA